VGKSKGTYYDYTIRAQKVIKEMVKVRGRDPLDALKEAGITVSRGTGKPGRPRKG